MMVPPGGTADTLVLSAAGFIATSTLGWSPGVRMSWSEMWTWNAETPASVPAGARISAGKSGSVDRSFPTSAEEVVKRSPVSCIPSPESPANRMTTRSSSWTVCGSVTMSAKTGVPSEVNDISVCRDCYRTQICARSDRAGAGARRRALGDGDAFVQINVLDRVQQLDALGCRAPESLAPRYDA